MTGTWTSTASPKLHGPAATAHRSTTSASPRASEHRDDRGASTHCDLTSYTSLCSAATTIDSPAAKAKRQKLDARHARADTPKWKSKPHGDAHARPVAPLQRVARTLGPTFL